MHSVLSSKSFRTSLLATLAFAISITAPHAAPAAEEVLSPAYRIRCSPVPAPSLTETWTQAIETGNTYGSMYSVSGDTYGDVCEAKPEYAMQLTEIPAGASFYKAWASAEYGVPPTASSVCATMSYDVEMWGLNAAGSWVLIDQTSGYGQYMEFSPTSAKCALGGSFVNSKAHALDGYSSVILSGHAQQLSGDLLPVTLGMTYPAQ